MIRTLKHAMKGERKSLDEKIDFDRFISILSGAGNDAINYKMRCGKGYQWLTKETSQGDIVKNLGDFFHEANNQFHEIKFAGTHQAYEGKDRRYHYIDCHQKLWRGNGNYQGRKTHEGTIWFEEAR